MSENKKSILHLEDDLHFQKYIGLLLSEIADITCAATLKQARALVLEKKFDLALIDFTLPDGSGADLVVELAKQNPPTPVVVFSAHEISNTMVNVSEVFVKGRFQEKAFVESIRALCQ